MQFADFVIRTIWFALGASFVVNLSYSGHRKFLPWIVSSFLTLLICLVPGALIAGLVWLISLGLVWLISLFLF